MESRLDDTVSFSSDIEDDTSGLRSGEVFDGDFRRFPAFVIGESSVKSNDFVGDDSMDFLRGFAAPLSGGDTRKSAADVFLVAARPLFLISLSLSVSLSSAREV